MLRVMIGGIRAVANSFLIGNQNPSHDQSSASKWHVFRNILFSVVSSLGIPFVRSFTENASLYECVNTLLAHSTTNRNTVDRHQRRSSAVSRFSRPNFRRRTHNRSSVIRIINPTIHVHVH